MLNALGLYNKEAKILFLVRRLRHPLHQSAAAQHSALSTIARAPRAAQAQRGRTAAHAHANEHANRDRERLHARARIAEAHRTAACEHAKRRRPCRDSTMRARRR